MTERTSDRVPASTHVGRVALTVGDLDAVLPFYRDAIGFSVERDGRRAALRAGDHSVLVLVEEPDAPVRPSDAAGLFHVAVRVPTRSALGDALVRIRDAGAELTGASDHLVSEALYLRDPDGNGLEVYRDRPPEAWPRSTDGTPEMDTLPLDLADLADAATGERTLPSATDVGHVHLEVADLDRSEAFYVDAVGLHVAARYGEEAAFVAAGDHHHHVGLNVWNRRRSPAAETRGLRWFELVLPDHGALEDVRRRLRAAGAESKAEEGDVLSVADPDDVSLRFVVEPRG